MFLYIETNTFYIYEFEDNIGEYIIVQKLTKDKDLSKDLVKIISKTNYIGIGDVFAFREDSVIKEIETTSNDPLKEIKQKLPQYFI
jgi:hypothetical protein